MGRRVRTKFYNEKQKECYIKEREVDGSNINIRRTMQVFFAATEKFERNLKKDCCNFSVREICDMLAGQNSSSAKFLENFRSQISRYTDWCIDNNKVDDNDNHYLDISKDIMTGFLNRNNTVITREELLKISSTFPNVSDTFMVLAIFEGFKRSDFYNLTLDKFNISKNRFTVQLEGRKLYVSQKLIELAVESANEYRKFNYDGETKGYKKTDDRVVKGSVNAMPVTLERSNKNIQERLARIKKEYGIAFGYKNLQNSGRINLVNKLVFINSSIIHDVSRVYKTYQSAIEKRYDKLYTDIPEWIEDNKKYILNLKYKEM